MTLNETIVADPRALTADELIQEYEKLSNAYQSLKTARESDIQQIFDQQKQIEILSKNLNFLGKFRGPSPINLNCLHCTKNLTFQRVKPTKSIICMRTN
jgi:hypothetical protein